MEKAQAAFGNSWSRVVFTPVTIKFVMLSMMKPTDNAYLLKHEIFALLCDLRTEGILWNYSNMSRHTVWLLCLTVLTTKLLWHI